MAPPTKTVGRFHAVRFYESADALARIVAEFVGDGLVSSQPGVIIAVPAHRDAVLAELRGLGFDIEQLQREGRLFLIEASALLAEFMVNGMPDPGRFRRALVPIMEQACAGRPECHIRAYGEMVDVLWKAGHTVAATRLETLWNQLATTHTFSLLCGYSMGSFYKGAAQEEICRQHTHIVSATGEVATVN